MGCRFPGSRENWCISSSLFELVVPVDEQFWFEPSLRAGELCGKIINKCCVLKLRHTKQEIIPGVLWSTAESNVVVGKGSLAYRAEHHCCHGCLFTLKGVTILLKAAPAWFHLGSSYLIPSGTAVHWHSMSVKPMPTCVLITTKTSNKPISLKTSSGCVLKGT